MRLSQKQIEAIKNAFDKVFVQGRVILFGSRLDDTKKGGDIDIYIDPALMFEDLFAKKVAFLVELKSQIGDQKVDLVLAPIASSDLKREIENTGVTLWRN